MSEFFKEIGAKLVFPIDFKAQVEVSKKLDKILLVGAVIASLYGYKTESVLNVLVCYSAFILIGFIVIVPAYPSYNMHKLEWVKPKIQL